MLIWDKLKKRNKSGVNIMEELDKIDLIKERMNVSYKAAKQVLDEVNGDVVQALIRLEEEQEATGYDKNIIKVKSEELVSKLKELIKEGNISKITVKNRDKTLLEIPVTAGVISLVLFPYLTVLAGMAAMYKEYKLEIERKEDEEENMEKE